MVEGEAASAGTYARVTNYDETGPGYLSAYGLVAAIHEEMRKGPDGARFFDNGIRTHGSFDYLSLRGRFSHGCHRLYNQLAMRLFSFVLDHRRSRVTGPVAARLPARVLFEGRGVRDAAADPRLSTASSQPPIPVEVLEGRIKGTLTKPIAGYVPKPGVKYVSRAAAGGLRHAGGQGGRGIAHDDEAKWPLLASLHRVAVRARAALRAARRCGADAGAAVTVVAPGRRRRERAAPRAAARRSRARAGARDDRADADTVTIKLIADARRQAHVYWGRKDLGVAPLEIVRPRGSAPLDL